MMEEQLLCRGRKLGSNNKWEEGYFVKYQPNSSIEEFVCGIVPSYASALYIVGVDPTSLLRFTGHTDKNNVRIFEGDTVRWKYKRAWGEPEHISKVVWDDFYHSWKLTVPGGLAKFRPDAEYEVIRSCYGKREE